MKKLINILGIIALTTTASTSVIACNKRESISPTPTFKNNYYY